MVVRIFFVYRLPLYDVTCYVKLYTKGLWISSSAIRVGHFGISKDTKGQKLTGAFSTE
jgi:hypothetical protein